MGHFLIHSGMKKMYVIGENGEEYIFQKESTPKNKDELDELLIEG